MSEQRDALRLVAQRHHLGALVLALEAQGRLPEYGRQLLLAAFGFVQSVGLADRSPLWDDDPERRSVWRIGTDARAAPSLEQIELWADTLTGMARNRGQYAATQWLLNHNGLWKRASEGLPLWHRAASDDLPEASVTALSPSDHATERALQALAEGCAKAGRRRCLTTTNPNEVALALWVELGSRSALLGADLLTGPAGCGWLAVVATHSPVNRASLHKIPHHGSGTAHLQDVWDELLVSQPISLLAPNRSGSYNLPEAADVTRVCSLSSAAYITAGVATPASGRGRRVQASMPLIAKNVREPDGTPGHVRARISLHDDSWRVETFWPADRLFAAS